MTIDNKGFWPTKEGLPVLNVAFEGFWDKDEVIWEHYFKTSHCFLWEKYDVRYNSTSPDVIFSSIFGRPEDYSLPTVGDTRVRILIIHENVPVQPLPFFDQFTKVISFTDQTTQANNIRIPYWVYRIFDQYASHCQLYQYTIPFNEFDIRSKVSLENRGFCAHMQSKAVPWREKTYDALAAYKQIDCGGMLHPNLHSGPEKDYMDKRLMGREANVQKYEFFRRRKFSFCLENDMNTIGYTTEKIIDSFAARTVPLYAGQFLPSDTFNPKALVNLWDFDTLNGWVERVKELDTNDTAYQEMLNEPLLLNCPAQFTLDGMLETYTKIIGG